MKYNVCPVCLEDLEDSCERCGVKWHDEEYFPPKQRFYKVKHFDPLKPNVFYVSNRIETTHDYKNSLGDTITEKNESLYLAILQVASQLGEIDSFFCSSDFWKDIWQHFYREGQPIPTNKGCFSGLKLATILRDKPLYLGFGSDAKYWVAVQCYKGIGYIEIEGLE